MGNGIGVEEREKTSALSLYQFGVLFPSSALQFKCQLQTSISSSPSSHQSQCASPVCNVSHLCPTNTARASQVDWSSVAGKKEVLTFLKIGAERSQCSYILCSTAMVVLVNLWSPDIKVPVKVLLNPSLYSRTQFYSPA